MKPVDFQTTIRKYKKLLAAEPGDRDAKVGIDGRGSGGGSSNFDFERRW